MLNKAVIDLHVIRDNALKIKKHIGKDKKFCAVVKADAYGHGAVVVANAIYSIVDCYAVATCEEGIALRLGGIDKDILVLFAPQKQDLPRAMLYGFIFTVYNRGQIDLISHYANLLGVEAKVHIKYDTGMNRLGVKGLTALKNLVEYSMLKKGIVLDGMYTHLGEFQNKKELNTSVDKFLLANNLVKGYNNINCHISSSGGLLSEIDSDWYRIGILLYGYKPFDSDKIKVCPAMKIYSPVLDKKKVARGERILYGDYRLEKDTNAVLVQYGYADGMQRKKSDNLINNRCMNISAYTDLKVEKGYGLVMDNAEVVARRLGTISYEILTKCGFTSQKIYLN